MNDWTPRTLAEVMAAPPGRGDWGPWILDPKYRCLFIPIDPAGDLRDVDNCEYYIDLETCLNPAAVLDWLAQIAGKTWANDAVLAGLLRAFDDVIHLQGNLCGMGQAGCITKSDIESMVQSAVSAGWTPYGVVDQ